MSPHMPSRAHNLCVDDTPAHRVDSPHRTPEPPCAAYRAARGETRARRASRARNHVRRAPIVRHPDAVISTWTFKRSKRGLSSCAKRSA
ncbi:hypothetical protein DM75_2901 [Burkholderia mallei]|nr:hypothetical protein DM75_2901 [Burkholderia mallei]KOS76651.1 hypothetical protein DM46_2337 [Burkholderia mallei]